MLLLRIILRVSEKHVRKTFAKSKFIRTIICPVLNLFYGILLLLIYGFFRFFLCVQLNFLFDLFGLDGF